MYDRFGAMTNGGNRNRQHSQQQHFTFTEQDIEDIFRQFFQSDNDGDNDPLFQHIFHRKAPRIITTKSGYDDKPFSFYSKTIYFVHSDNNYNQKIDSYRIKYPFEKSNREYGREILEIIRYLLQSLPFKFGTKSEENGDEYYLIKYIIDTDKHNQYLFSEKSVNLAQRLYNLRNHLIHWTRTKKQMSYKSVNHYMNVGKQFIIELQKQPQFQYFQFIKHFKIAQLNMDILHHQFISHKSKEREERKKYGNLRGCLDSAYNEYKTGYWTRGKWFIAGVATTILAIAWLVRNVDIDDIDEQNERR